MAGGKSLAQLTIINRFLSSVPVMEHNHWREQTFSGGVCSWTSPASFDTCPRLGWRYEFCHSLGSRLGFQHKGISPSALLSLKPEVTVV